MQSTGIRVGVAAVLAALLIFLYGRPAFPDYQLAQVFSGKTCPEKHLCVHFLDVGQGDATFIESAHGAQVLIDGGPGSGVLRELGAHMGFFDRTLDMVVATHPDGDHVGGLIDVFDRYAVAAAALTQNTNDTSASQSFHRAVEEEQAQIVHPRTGDVVDLGGGAKLEILFPDRDASGLESNTASMVARLVYGETAFLFTGDSPQAVETYLVSLYGDELESDVLKVGHHGSKTSTADTFVSAVDPEHAVISAGADNRYGHPHQAVLETLTSSGATVYTTADAGTITLITDGENVTVR